MDTTDEGVDTADERVRGCLFWRLEEGRNDPSPRPSLPGRSAGHPRAASRSCRRRCTGSSWPWPWCGGTSRLPICAVCGVVWCGVVWFSQTAGCFLSNRDTRAPHTIKLTYVVAHAHADLVLAGEDADLDLRDGVEVLALRALDRGLVGVLSWLWVCMKGRPSTPTRTDT